MTIDRRERLNDLLNTLDPDLRITAARQHVQAVEDASRMTRRQLSRELTYSSVLSGWDQALSIAVPELAEENHELHSMVYDLCQRLCLRRCEHCRGASIDWQSSGTEPVDCPHCTDGWIDVADDSPERIAAEIAKRSKP